MKPLLLLLFTVNSFLGNTQKAQYPFVQLYQLDSIGSTSSISKYFGRLYFTFLGSIEKQLSSADSTTIHLVRHFEAVFAQFYIDACTDYYNHKAISIHDWEAYFSDSTLEPVQYILLGTNAHLNGRLWDALAKSFTLEQMQTLKGEFIIFKKSLNKTYRKVYKMALNETKDVQKLHLFTLGGDKLLGYYYLYKWRRREMKLARLYLSNAADFEPLLARVNKEREKINEYIFRLR